MYEDAYALGAGCVTVNNNIIKFEAPPYIKGGFTMVPVAAIAAQLGAEITWDSETQTVSIVKDNVTIELTANSQTVNIDGTAVELEISPEISCGRTYVPLRFLAEAFDLAVTWDSENEIIDLDDGTTDDGSTDAGSTDDGTTDDGATDDGTTDDGATDDGATDDGTTDDGATDDGTNGRRRNGRRRNGRRRNGRRRNGRRHNGRRHNGRNIGRGMIK
jgi:hypothetical protein